MATDHDRLGLPPLVRENLEAFLNGLRARFGDARLFARLQKYRIEADW